MINLYIIKASLNICIFNIYKKNISDYVGYKYI